jgi:glycerol-3-phosphate O-acyltransferase
MAATAPAADERREKSAAPPAPASDAPYVVSGKDIGREVTRRVMERTISRSDSENGPHLDDVAFETIYAEETRLAHAAPEPRTAADRAFIGWFRHELAHATEGHQKDLLYAVVDRYAQEIAGHFDVRAYRVATRVVPPALGALLSGLSVLHRDAFDIDDRILVEGETRALRALARVGTVILAPTHVSNLDSLVLGSVIYRLGLPPFAYAAGLNLFSSALIGFFMRHLGAYTVDRKKTDPLYRATLKEYATVLLERGQHSLIFPGGTRSRSGAIENKLKLGLLGTGPTAFRNAVEARSARPNVFIVPCTLSYPLVLESSTLIQEYLRLEGGPLYTDIRDEFDKPRRWLDFLRGLRALDQRVHVRFSRPLDWLGNEVDETGVSRDRRGCPIDLRRYLIEDGRLSADEARDTEYTRLLASRVVSAYQRDNVALPTTVVGFVVFECFRRLRARLDLFRFLRGLAPEPGVPVPQVLTELAHGLDELERLRQRGEIALSADVREKSAAGLLQQALATFATYHRVPVVERRADRLHVLDPGLLLYYRNRLEGYGLCGGRSLLASTPLSSMRHS